VALLRRALLLGGFLVLAACGAPQRPDGGQGLLPVGAEAPALRAVDHEERPVDLGAERGRPVVVFFYPKDGTPGCTREACAFRDVWGRYEEAKIRVLGVSADTAEAHRKFAQEHRLPFSLIADTSGDWARAFGVGSTLGMYRRVTFLIGADGKVARVYPDVDPGVHAEQVLAEAQAR
jgi:peroxiredoxin Q/BCP